MQGLMDAFVVRTKRKAPENSPTPFSASGDKTPTAYSQGRVTPKRPRATSSTLRAAVDGPSVPSSLWSEGVQAGTVWSYVVDALLDNVPLSRIVRVIKTLGALAAVSRLLHDVLHLKRIRVDVLNSISQYEGRESPSKPVTVMCSAVPLALVGTRRKLVFELFTNTEHEGVSLMVAHGLYTTERHWYRARTGLLCRRTTDDLCKKAAQTVDGIDDDDDDDDSDGTGDESARRHEDGRLFWPKCERMIEMPLSHILWDDIRWTNKAPWKDDNDKEDNHGNPPKDPIDDHQKGCDLEGDEDRDEERHDTTRAEKDVGRGSPVNVGPDGDGANGDNGGDDWDDNDRDDGDDDDDDDDHDDEFGKWLSFDDGRWSMCIFHDYRGRMSLYKVSVCLL
ncbi:hypothetical protein pkur_cds_258 [Pandoravirus kuranda]|uniref:Uncharacterized protein n=2 Tax=Pandoravirus TaxID=2060084 RepID=A0AA95EGG0_9VIRU|nr:hypothetical protein pneo_cds_284 [Pandoravirus neocaledonia]AVK75891.1 hypothetical protein pneo_cds_284 [Pandoravirus neocaledonia]WBR14433.1 hypothetical protein pkur_cds_258 [Pandoravirus kuranda]